MHGRGLYAQHSDKAHAWLVCRVNITPKNEGSVIVPVFAVSLCLATFFNSCSFSPVYSFAYSEDRLAMNDFSSWDCKYLCVGIIFDNDFRRHAQRLPIMHPLISYELNLFIPIFISRANASVKQQPKIPYNIYAYIHNNRRPNPKNDTILHLSSPLFRYHELQSVVTVSHCLTQKSRADYAAFPNFGLAVFTRVVHSCYRTTM